MSRDGDRVGLLIATTGMASLLIVATRGRRLINKPLGSRRLIDKPPDFIAPTDRSIIREITQEEAARYEDIGLSDKDRVLLLENVNRMIQENNIILRAGDAEFLLQSDLKSKIPRKENGNIDFEKVNDKLSSAFIRSIVAGKIKDKLAER